MLLLWGHHILEGALDGCVLAIPVARGCSLAIAVLLLLLRVLNLYFVEVSTIILLAPLVLLLVLSIIAPLLVRKLRLYIYSVVASPSSSCSIFLLPCPVGVALYYLLLSSILLAFILALISVIVSPIISTNIECKIILSIIGLLAIVII